VTEIFARLRQLWRHPSHTIAVALSLAIGMAVCVAVFSVVNVVVFATIPGISERRTLVRLSRSNHRGLFTPADSTSSRHRRPAPRYPLARPASSGHPGVDWIGLRIGRGADWPR
jgi:hypothetical protein